MWRKGEAYSVFHHSDLVGSPRSGEAMGDEDSRLRLPPVILATRAGDSV